MTVKAAINSSASMEALVDGGSQLNLLSATLAKEQELSVDPLPQLGVEGAGGSQLPVYGITTCDVTITDSRGRQQTHVIPFVVADLRRYKMYLGLPWIDAHNPKMNFARRRTLFRGVKDAEKPKFQKIAVEDAEEFDATIRSPSTDVYACSVNFVGQGDLPRPIVAQLPDRYADYADLGGEGEASALPDPGPQDLAITLEEGHQPPFQPLYNLSQVELDILRKYLAEYLQRGWIRRSKSPAGAPILFAKKKDGSLRLCVDYRGLNKVTIKNRHPLPLITESLERLAQAKVFSKVDVRDAYHRIRIKAGDEWKTAFRTRYGHFEYTVMPFGLTNAPAQFQAYINQALSGLIDVTCVVYLDDILIFSNSEEEHEAHVRQVLDRLRDYKLYIKPSKCEWHTKTTEFLGYIISPDGISIDPSRVKTVQEWPEPRTVRDIRVFIGFMNYYRRFIQGFSRLALPLTKLTQKGPLSARGGLSQRREEGQPLDIGEEGTKAFKALKSAFLDVPILSHFERGRKTRAEVDASGGAICGILSQLVQEGNSPPQWRPVDFFSRKLIQAEYNYDTHDQELLAIVKSLQHWRHYLEGIHFEILTDHQNLKWFMETKVLNHRQVRSYLELSKYDFVITHRPGATNPADGPSRRPDYMAEAQKPSQKHNEAFVAPLRRLLSRTSNSAPLVSLAVLTRRMGVPEKQAIHKELAEAKQTSANDPKALEERGETEWEDEDESSDSEVELAQNGPPFPQNGRSRRKELSTTEEKAAALAECHDNPLSGHFGSRKTLEKLQRRYVWKGMTKDVEKYTSECLRCRRSVAAKHRPYGLLNPLQPPTRAWEDVTMDFITELPPSKLSGVVYDSILVIVCKLTKMAHYVPARADWDGVDLAQAWMREIVRLHGVPRRIISDRGPLMNSRHWKTFNHYMNSRRVLTSAFHPQTDGQTERQNQTLEQYLRCYCCLEQDDWAWWISVAEFAYNDSVQATTGITPFKAYTGMDPISAEWPKIPLGDGESPMGLSLAARVLSLQQECKKKIIAANAYQKAYADKKRLPAPFKVGDKVLVSTRHIRSLRPKKKLDWKYLGPGTITEQFGPAAYKVEVQGLGGAHPTFHASLLEPYEAKGAIQHPDEPIVDTLAHYGDEVFEVDEIKERRRGTNDQWEYLIKWKGYGEEENSWEPGASISQNTLHEFWKRKGIASRRSQSKTKYQETGITRRRGRPPSKKGSQNGK